ncbi:MAG: hypothetical protein JWO53_1237 [Chlamydiia bacterium]|nr:hypothetical protein [Chlamydiia bacterium]
MGCDLKTISHYLKELLRPEDYQDVSLNGLQVEGRFHIATIATAVSASLQVIYEATKMRADLLIVHHGLFLKGCDLVVKDTMKEKLKFLLTHDTSLIGYHLPLDAHQEFGNNWPVAKALGWSNLEPFGIYHGMPIGVKATFPLMPRENLQKTLEDFYGHPGHVALGGKEIVGSCALVSGGAHKLIFNAADENVDCYITGSFDEPIWHAAYEKKINFMAFGHAATEKIGVQRLGEHLQQKFHLAHTFIDEPNPF